MMGRKEKEIAAPTKELIEKHALLLLSEKGYVATSVREIAQASGVTKPVIYYYFKCKEDLCQHLIQSGLDEFRFQLRDICEQKFKDPVEQITRVVDAHFDFCRCRPDFVRFIYALNFGPDRKKIDYDFVAYGFDILRMLTDLMRSASAAGIIRRGKEETAVYYLRGIISTYVMLYVDGRGELPRTLARTIVDDLVNGLKPSGSGFK